MSKQNLKKEIQKLQRTVEKAPRVWRFRGRRVVRGDDWNYGDWSKLPDAYHPLGMWSSSIPKDWFRDYVALLEKIEDPAFGTSRCYHCAIYQAQDLKKEIERGQKYWQENGGGEEAKKKFYEECGEPRASEFRRQDAMREAQWRLYNEAAGAENRTCSVINYFQCPYRDERQTLTEDGYSAHTLWKHIYWYDHHWNLDTSVTPRSSELKWYHFGEPPIIDVKSFEDIIKALEDGRLEKIILEHKRYMKETGAQIWGL